VKSAKFARAVNPYKNEVLRELFERGRTRVVTPNDPLGARPPGPGPQSSRPSQPPPPRSTRPNDRGGERRDPFRGNR
jgi:hypothetical protein